MKHREAKDPDYRAFARDMMRLCKKHGVRMVAHNEGFVGLAPADARNAGDFRINDFGFSREEAYVGDPSEAGYFRILKGE